MKDAIETSTIAFAAIVAIVLVFAAVLGLLSAVETKRRRKARAKKDAEAWTELLGNQLHIAPFSVGDTEAAAALDRARKLHHGAVEKLKTAKKTKQYTRIRTYALAGLHNLNIMRRRLGKAPGPQGPIPFNTATPGKASKRDDNVRDAATGPSTGLPFLPERTKGATRPSRPLHRARRNSAACGFGDSRSKTHIDSHTMIAPQNAGQKPST